MFPRDIWTQKEAPINYGLIANKVWKRILMPPLIFWDSIKWMANALAGEALGKLILPAAYDPKLKEKLDEFRQSLPQRLSTMTGANPQQSFRFLTLNTAQGVPLDALQLSYSSSNKYIIYFRSENECFEHPDVLDEMVRDSQNRKCNVIAFNYRGINDSGKREDNSVKPTSAKDLVNDGMAMVQYLLNRKIPSNNITLKGISLGGTLTTLVAKECHKNGDRINVIAGESVSNMTRYVVGLIRAVGENLKIKYPSFIGSLLKNVFNILGYLSMPFIKWTLTSTQWEMKAAKAYKQLPRDNKDYFLVKNDGTIPDWSSLHKDEELRKLRKKQKKNTQSIIELYKNKISTANYSTEIDSYKASINSAIAEQNHWLKSRKMHFNNPSTTPNPKPSLKKNSLFFKKSYPEENKENGHGKPLNKLINHEGKNADQYFYDFLDRIDTPFVSNPQNFGVGQGVNLNGHLHGYDSSECSYFKNGNY